VAEQGDTKIVKLHAGALAYQGREPAMGAANSAVLYNTVTTPKGGQYQILLPDGSKVWLNAASSIRFPTIFTDKRSVAITGEVYFEIARDREKPFEVASRSQVIQVVGTSFNVNAYEDEDAVQSTLVDGSIVVKAAGEELRLQRGQQSIVRSGLTLEKTADLSKVMAWKNGYFNFNGSDIRAAMRVIARWYDLEIVYEGQPGNIEIMGEMERSLSLSQVMNVLKNLHVNYRMEGKKIIMMP
jgi:ferric-dicitrate binding protein FerR (iron transport regulator)